MTTLVGTQKDFADALKELCELDYDAIEAYKTAIKRLDNPLYISKLTEFMGDHERHTDEISQLLAKHSVKIPEGPSMKKFLTQGKVVLADLMGDDTILKAMQSNEVDTNTAYERLNKHEGKWTDSVQILERGLADERRHKAWIDAQLSQKGTFRKAA